MADDVSFCNCLIIMHPKTIKANLSSHASVCTKITNEFLNYLTTIKCDTAAAPGKICTLWDLWIALHISDFMIGLMLQ